MSTHEPMLVEPTARVYHSYRAAVEEYRAEGGYPDFKQVALTDRAAMQRHVHQVRAEWTGPQRYLWWLVWDDEYLGRISLRRPDEETVAQAGQLGYDIRPTRRRQGHATRMVGLVLPLAAALGIDPIMTQVRPHKRASRRVLENNAAILLGHHNGWLWFRLSASPRNN